MNWQEHIVPDNNVLLCKPTIKGIRLSVDHIISLLAQGWNEQQVLDNYPRLTHEDIKAVFAYIYECMQDGMFPSGAPGFMFLIKQLNHKLWNQLKETR